MTMPVRECQNCGSKLPFARPRIRQDNGELWCAGCDAGAPGTRMHGSVVSSRDPRLLHATEEDLVRTLGKVLDPNDHRQGLTLDIRQAQRKADEGWAVANTSYAGWEAWQVTPPGGWPDSKTSLRVEAHDSGDTETIFHCPFCGGGQVWGRSDGTTQCDFCQAAFTVQVQPMRNAMPQTINGQPVAVPGMPGEVGTPQDAAQQASENQGTAFQPPDAIAAPFEPPTQIAAHYVTSRGAALDEESYLRHLAIRFADDDARAAMIAEIRSSRARHG